MASGESEQITVAQLLQEAASSEISANDRQVTGARFLCVDYPGIVKNVEKAIDTLGGLNKMAYDHYKTGTLELDYHRDNIYSRPAASRQRAGTCLAVKVRRKKPRPVEEGGPSKDQTQELPKRDEIEGEILGVISSVHRFSTMFDFQFLPLKRTSPSEQTPTFEDILPKLLPSDLSCAREWLPDESTATEAPDAELFLPPYAFSRFTLPNFLVMGREPHQVNPTKGSETAASSSAVVGLSLRKDRRFTCFMVQGHEAFPIAPHPSTVAQVDARCKFSNPHELVKALFDERPVWSKSAVMFRTELDEHVTRTLLPKYAFYILSGPFGRTWCRFGFDPRKDRSSVVYQTVMINLAKLGFGGKDTSRISYKIPAANRLKVTSRGIHTSRDMPISKAKKSWYTFEPGILPPFRQVWYQVADIKLDVVAEEVQKALAAEEVVFRDGHSENTGAGWLLPGAADRIREAMKLDMRLTLDRLDTEVPSGETAAIIDQTFESDDESQDEIDGEDLEYVMTTGLSQTEVNEEPV